MFQYSLDLSLIHIEYKGFLPRQADWGRSIIIWQETCYAASGLLTSCHSTANSVKSRQDKGNTDFLLHLHYILSTYNMIQ